MDFITNSNICWPTYNSLLQKLEQGYFSLFISHKAQGFLFNLHFHDRVIWDYQRESPHHHPGIRIPFPHTQSLTKEIT